MTALEEYTKYQYLIDKTINYMKKLLGAISDDACEELASIGRSVLWREISTRPPHERSDKMRMDVYLIYRLKLSYRRALVKASSYWPWTADKPVMVAYNEEGFRKTPGIDTDLDRQIWVKALRTDLERALDVVTPKQRCMIELKYFGGLSEPEIGEIVGRTHQNINTTSRRGLVTMREQCGDTLRPYLEDLGSV